MMRVLHILNELRPSGVETMLRSAAGEWRKQGIAGEILCTGERPGAYADTLRDAGFAIHHHPFRRSPAFLLAVATFLGRNRFDVIHIHAERANFWYAALAYATGHRQIVRTVQNVFPFRGALRFRRYLQRWIMRQVFGVRMSACSESVQSQEVRSFRNPATVLPNWFDSEVFRRGERAKARAALGIPADTFAVCSVGNCSSVKNHAVVIQALAASVPMIYLHVGEEEAGGHERRLADDLGVANQVRFFGPRLELCSLFQASDLFVMPSLYEGFGIAAVEAMGAGLPVALADVAGLQDFRGMDPSIHWLEPTAAGVGAALLHFHGMSVSERQAAGERLSVIAHRQFGVQAGAARYAAFYRERP